MIHMTEAEIWADIERIANTTGQHPDDVYAQLIIEFQELVAQRLEESYTTRRPRLKINEFEFRRLYQSDMSINDLVAHFKISRSSVRSFRIKLHLRPRRFMVKYDKREYKRLFKAGIKYSEMAKILGMSRNTVMETRKRLGLPTRYNWRPKVKND
jgi:hypothetical protein